MSNPALSGPDGKLPATTVIPCTMAVAAISTSRSARGSGACSPAHSRAVEHRATREQGDLLTFPS